MVEKIRQVMLGWQQGKRRFFPPTLQCRRVEAQLDIVILLQTYLPFYRLERHTSYPSEAPSSLAYLNTPLSVL